MNRVASDRYLSQPSPSLGPPLLSASWSPPLFWGIVHSVVVDCDPPEDDTVVLDAGGAFAGVFELELQDANATADAPINKTYVRGNTFLLMIFDILVELRHRRISGLGPKADADRSAGG